MKIRTGFVSNSSSSSFILIFDEMPKSVEDLIKILNFNLISNEFTPEAYAWQIFEDLQCDDASNEQVKNLLDDTEYKSFQENSKNKHVKIVEYSDNDGDFYSELEHGNVFANIEHFYICQH